MEDVKQAALDIAATAEACQVEVISKRTGKRLEAYELVVARRQDQNQDVGFNSRHMVLCSLPFKPIKALKYERRNGSLSLQIVGHPDYGVPFGQDRLWLIWLATEVVRQKSRVIRFKHAGEILTTFDLGRTGPAYARLKQGLQRIFASTIYFGSENEQSGELILDWKRYHYLDGMKLWFRRQDVQEGQEVLPDQTFWNEIEVSEYFYNELIAHPIPVDLNVVRALSDSPGALDFYTWVAWRSWRIERNREIAIPLTGPSGLDMQLTAAPYSQKRRWRAKVGEWIRKTKALWPECPVRLSADGNCLIVGSGQAIQGRLPEAP